MGTGYYYIQHANSMRTYDIYLKFGIVHFAMCTKISVQITKHKNILYKLDFKFNQDYTVFYIPIIPKCK